VHAIDEHLGYLSDPVRLEAYRAAVARSVRDGSVVADLGCGTGVLGLMCLQAGAARVYGIDSTSVIDLARASFSRAGLLDRAVFTRCHSTRTDLPEQVDLVICDQVGYFGLDAGIVQGLVDARRRFLRPGGRLIPSRLKLYAAAVESAEAYRPVIAWREEPVPPALRWLSQYAVDARYPVRLAPAELLGPPVLLGDIDLCADDPALFSWKASLPIQRSGTLHGVAGWFECELVEGVWMTNSPLAGRPIQRPQAFLPIAEAADVSPGERLSVTVMVKPRDNMIAWVVELPSGQYFRHSTWHGTPLALEDLRRADSAHVPRLTRDGRARAIVLHYCDGRRTTDEIERMVLSEHPDLFPSQEAAARFVVHVLSRDTE
jgi:protein arginine N-methyltransferase 1